MMRFCLAPQIFLPTNWENNHFWIFGGICWFWCSWKSASNLTLKHKEKKKTNLTLHRPSIYFIAVLLLSHIWLFGTLWIAARQASLSFTIFQSLLKLMFIEPMMPRNHLFLCHPLFLLPSIFLSIRVFSMTWLLASDGQSIGTSASASVLPIQGWFPLGLTGFIS